MDRSYVSFLFNLKVKNKTEKNPYWYLVDRLLLCLSLGPYLTYHTSCGCDMWVGEASKGGVEVLEEGGLDSSTSVFQSLRL